MDGPKEGLGLHECFRNTAISEFVFKNLCWYGNLHTCKLIPIKVCIHGLIILMIFLRYFQVSDFALGQIVDRPPQCLYDLVANPGVKTMHTYVRNYGTLCIDDRNQ